MALYVSDVLINIDGVAASSEFKNDLLQVCVEESLHLPGMFTLVINNPYAPGDSQTQTWQHKDLIKIGAKIEIGFQPSTTTGQTNIAPESYIIAGEIAAVETHFTSTSQAPILVRGYDISHRLHRGRHNRSFQDIKDSDLVAQIAGEVGIPLGQITSTTQTYPYLFQQNQTNMEFLRHRAARIGYELYVQDGQLHFTQPTAGTPLQLTWMQDLTSFRVRVSTAEQVNSVEVRSWDYRIKQPIVETATNADRVITDLTNLGNGRDHISSFDPNNNPSKMILVDRPVDNNQEAKAIAEALFDELEGEFIYADAKAVGNPEIRVGKVVTLSNMGDYDGQYYVTETRHLYYQREYQTEFSVRGLRGGNLLQIIGSGNRLQPSQTMLVGIVTNNQDPQNLGRVRVKFPTLNPETSGKAHESWWARVVGVGAGKNRGWYCLPEINDEVLVAFEHGDINRPYIIGGVWNGVDRPPEDIDKTVPPQGPNQGNVRLRTFQTTTGHSLRFVENNLGNDQAGIYLQTANGNQISLNDSAQYLEVKTKNNSHIRLDDKSKRVEIKTQGGHFYVLDDVTKTIHIQSSGTVNIKSAGNINLNPAIGQVGVSSLLTCPTLLTGSLMFGTSLASAVDVIQSITTLQNQVASLSEELGLVQSDLQKNAANDLQQAQLQTQLQNQLNQVQTDLQQNIALDAQQATKLDTLRTDLNQNIAQDAQQATQIDTLRTDLNQNIAQDTQQAQQISDLQNPTAKNTGTNTDPNQNNTTQ